MPNHHLSFVLSSIKALAVAMRVAKDTLPEEIKSLHWQAKQHSQSPWRSVEAHCRGQVGADVLDTLTDLTLMDEALSSLTTVAAPKADRTVAPNLKLSPQRRSTL